MLQSGCVNKLPDAPGGITSSRMLPDASVIRAVTFEGCHLAEGGILLQGGARLKPDEA